MFTTIIRSVLTACALLLSTAAFAAESMHPELPIEAVEVSVTHATPGGFILVRPCENCAMVSLQFDANSKAYFHWKPVGLSAIPEHSKSAVTVIYDPATKIVKRVFW